MDQKKVITLEDRIPKLKAQRKQRSNHRLVFYLSIFFLLLLTVIYFQSPLSDVKVIDIEGNRYISNDEILKVSGLKVGTSFLSVDTREIEKDLTSKVEINKVTVERKFPNKIEIVVKEFSTVAYLVLDGKFFPILESGKILDQLQTNEFPSDAPLLIDWNAGDALAEMAAELRNVPEGIIHRISEIYHTPVETDPLRITLLMNDGYKVSSTIRHFSTKIIPYPAIVKELDPNIKGIIHMKMNPYFEQFSIGEEEEIEGEG